jgi:FkbH-like protein
METPIGVFKNSTAKSFTDYLSIGKTIQTLNSQGSLEIDTCINIAILSSSSMNGVNEVLTAQCSSFNIYSNIYIAEYGQYAQEIFNSESHLYSFNADLIIINIDFKSIAESYEFLPYEKTVEERKAWLDETIIFFEAFVNEVTSRSSAKVLLHNLAVPLYSPMGIIESKETYGFIESIEDVNRGLREKYKSSNQVYIYDFNGFCSKIGKTNILDYKMYYLADIKVKTQFIPDLCSDYFKYIQSLAYKTKKCIVLDLDNTLWGGIVGEVGMEGIHLGPTPEGRSFLEFQKQLLALHNRGIILAINSKNNEDDAMDVIKNHPYMVLREKCFASTRINWEDKVSNLKSLAEEINISLDSVVFFDDDQMNRDMVRTLLPDVTVVDLPKDFSLYVSILQGLNCFETLSISSEDTQRNKMYQAEKQRTNLLKNTSALSDYLQSLNLKAYIEEANKSTIARIAQLTQKTNQFNLTTQRLTEENIQEFSMSDDYRVISIRVTDKFGDSGLTGVAIVNIKNPTNWEIETFLLSCRVIGRKVEEALLAYIISQAKANNAKFVFGYFSESKKNSLVKDFYANNGFEKINNKFQEDIWKFDVKNDYLFPNYIKCEGS